MAIYEGARPRAGLLPRGIAIPQRRDERPIVRPHAPTLQRRRARVTVRARRQPRIVGFALGGVVLAFLVSFFSLVQTVRVSASDYEADRLNTQYSQLVQQRQQLDSQLGKLSREPAIRRQGVAAGLNQLPGPIVLPAR